MWVLCICYKYIGYREFRFYNFDTAKEQLKATKPEHTLVTPRLIYKPSLKKE